MSALTLASHAAAGPAVVYPSPQTRAHFFAVLHAAWLNLPEREAVRWPGERGFRQYLLIRAGFCTQVATACASVDEARDLAARVRPSKPQDFVLVVLDGALVWVFEAKSQTAKALPADAFAALKERVFVILAGMLGVDPLDLSERSGGAA